VSPNDDDGPAQFPPCEFAGAAISPRGDALFVNTQAAQGRAFAIWSERGILGF
jgi:secreted PhoX family phosphatase